MLDDLACSVSDDRLVDCSSNQGTFNCDHRSDAGVICVPAYTTGPGECNKKNIQLTFKWCTWLITKFQIAATRSRKTIPLFISLIPSSKSPGLWAQLILLLSESV